VDGIDLNVEHGELFSLLGPNGAGKTTTIKMLCCLLKPTGGTATIMGHDIRKDPLSVKGVIDDCAAVDDNHMPPTERVLPVLLEEVAVEGRIAQASDLDQPLPGRFARGESLKPGHVPSLPSTTPKPHRSPNLVS